MFADEMLSGAFKTMRHRHSFRTEGAGTSMSDYFEYTAPLGILGKLAEWLFLTRYMTRFLETRNRVLKRMAESDERQRYLAHGTEQDVEADV